MSFEQTKDWGWTPVIHPDDLENCLKNWNESIKTGNPYEVEYRFLRASDQTYRWHLGRALPFRNKKGEIVYWFGTCTDIHDQKMANERLSELSQELNSLNTDLTEKNDELIKINSDLDIFVYSASHDLKAPVANIEGLIIALNEEIHGHSNSDIDMIIDMINQSIVRFKNSLADLTEIAEIQKESGNNKDSIYFKDIINDIILSINDMVKLSRANITIDIDQAPAIHFSKKNLKSLMYNLISNAVKYRSPDKVPEILIKTEKVEDHIVLTIRDNGLGMSIKDKTKIFLMFKRLHTHIEGSGLGLYLVKRIIDNAGGSIEVESEVGKGSEFRVYFKVDSIALNS